MVPGRRVYGDRERQAQRPAGTGEGARDLQEAEGQARYRQARSPVPQPRLHRDTHGLGCEFIAIDNPHANKLTVHILAAVAQHEREIISARTSAALKVQGAGQAPGKPQAIRGTASRRGGQEERADRYSANVLPIMGNSRERHQIAARGCACVGSARYSDCSRCAWTPVQVSAILQRAK